MKEIEPLSDDCFLLAKELRDIRLKIVYRGLWIVTEGYWEMGQAILRYEREGKVDIGYGKRTAFFLAGELNFKDVSEIHRLRQTALKFPTKESLEKERIQLLANGYTASWSSFRRYSLPSATQHPEKYGGKEVVVEGVLSNIESLLHEVDKLHEMYDTSSDDVKRQADGLMEKAREVLRDVKNLPFEQPISRDKDYLAFIRTLPCVLCDNQPSEAAHIRTAGVGIKTTDYETIPLCAKHHELLHLTGVRTFAINEGLDLWHEVAKCLIKYIGG